MPGTRGPVPVPFTTNTSQPRDLTKEILTLLETKPEIHTADDFPDVSQVEIKAALDRLASRQMIQYDTVEAEKVILTKEGQVICDEGSHEFKVWDAVKRKGRMGIKELPVSGNMVYQQSNTKIASSFCAVDGWIGLVFEEVMNCY